MGEPVFAGPADPGEPYLVKPFGPPVPAPISFKGDWDCLIVNPAQVSSTADGLHVYLSADQLDVLIEARRRSRLRPGYEQADIPYFRAHDIYPDLLIRRLNGEETVGGLLTGTTEFVPVSDFPDLRAYPDLDAGSAT